MVFKINTVGRTIFGRRSIKVFNIYHLSCFVTNNNVRCLKNKDNGMRDHVATYPEQFTTEIVVISKY